jgi:predicted TIM-barrel fold metal-dependent hydrolase
MLCDSHVHVVGAPPHYLFIPERAYFPGLAPLVTLREQARRRGIERFVIVQPSFYGADNRLLIAALGALGDRGRGVAIIDPARIDDAGLERLKRSGVRGLRVNLYTRTHRGDLPPAGDAINGTMNAAARAGLHVEVIAPLAVLVANADRLAKAPIPVVLDHYGVNAGFSPDRGEGRSLVTLMGEDHVWMKLSAPYRSSADELATEPDRAWLDAFLKIAPDRCVWGSDWPFTPDEKRHRGPDVHEPYRAIAYEDLHDRFAAAVADAAIVRKIMIDNPSRLYEFARSDA